MLNSLYFPVVSLIPPQLSLFQFSSEASIKVKYEFRDTQSIFNTRIDQLIKGEAHSSRREVIRLRLSSKARWYVGNT